MDLEKNTLCCYTSPKGIVRYRDIRTGELHRLDGPAITHPDGTEKWYWQGRVHRNDGPAIMYPNGKIEWWYNGSQRSFKGWCNLMEKNDEEIVQLKLTY